MTAVSRRPSLESSLLRRLALLYVATVVVTGAVYLGGAWASHEIEVSYQLRPLAGQLAGFAVRDEGGTLHLPLPAERRRQLDGIPDFRMVVADAASGQRVEGSSETLAAEVSGLLATWTEADFARQWDGRVVHGILTTVSSPAGAMRMVMVRGPPTVREMLVWVGTELISEVLPVLAPVMVLTLVIGAVTVRRAMAPLKRLSAEAAAIGPHPTGRRLAEAGVAREVLPLVQAVNRAVTRIELALQQQRRMTANAAHELRTPLAILRARLDGPRCPFPRSACRDDRPECGLRGDLERDAVRISRLVEQLMAVANLEAGQVAVDGTMDLARVVREVLADAAPLAMAQGRGVELSAPSRPVILPGNAMALGDALVNLIDNALRFTPEGESVEVAIEAPASGSGPVAVEVRDRGPGIAPEDRARLFEPFWRGSDPRGKGSGLGLAIVAETVAVHRGTVSVRERPGGGSVFRIELPVTVPSGRREGTNSPEPAFEAGNGPGVTFC